MIKPETHRENRHRTDAAQRKTCQTVQKPDINNNSIPDPEICESGSREFPALRRQLSAFQVVAPRCESRSWNKAASGAPGTRASPRRRLPGLMFGRFFFRGAVPDRYRGYDLSR